MESFKALGTGNFNSPYKLRRLFEAYVRLEDSKVGFAFTIARRLLTLALELGAFKSTFGAGHFLSKITSSIALRPSMNRLLERWIRGPAANRLSHILTMEAGRFSRLLLHELERLDAEKEKRIQQVSTQENIYFKSMCF